MKFLDVFEKINLLLEKMPQGIVAPIKTANYKYAYENTEIIGPTTRTTSFTRLSQTKTIKIMGKNWR